MPVISSIETVRWHSSAAASRSDTDWAAGACRHRRHGTQTLIAGFDVTIGKVAGVIGDTRTEQDFARFLDTLLSTMRRARARLRHTPPSRFAR
jgi:hypothetical protein